MCGASLGLAVVVDKVTIRVDQVDDDRVIHNIVIVIVLPESQHHKHTKQIKILVQKDLLKGLVF